MFCFVVEQIILRILIAICQWRRNTIYGTCYEQHDKIIYIWHTSVYNIRYHLLPFSMSSMTYYLGHMELRKLFQKAKFCQLMSQRN